MKIKEFLKRFDLVVCLVRILRKIRVIPYLLYRPIAIRSYMCSHTVKKLQLGAGGHLDTWLCTDVAPAHRKVVYLNATRPFPFADSTFDYVFSEHMIEHISYEQGRAMLRECHRILKPRGTVRIAAPDLAVLLGLYSATLNPTQRRYIQWITDSYIGVGSYEAVFVINNAFRNWGHQFLYDRKLLQMAMTEAGFVDIRCQAPGASGDASLQGIEAHGKNVGDEEMNAFETMVLEGTCSK